MAAWNRTHLRRLFGLARPEARNLSFATVALVIASGLSLSYPLLLQRLVDALASDAGPEVMKQTGALLLVLPLLSGITGSIRAFLFTLSGERVVARLRQTLYAALVRQEIGFFDSQRTGELTSRLSSDTTVMQNTVSVNVSMALRFSITSVAAMVMLFLTSWKLTLVMLSIVPVAAVGMSIYGRLLRRIAGEAQDALARATAVAEETLSGIRTVRAFAREHAEAARYAAAVDETFAVARRRARYGAIFQGSTGFLGFGALGAVLWYGATLYLDQSLSAGELIKFMTLTLMVAASVGALAGLWEDLQKAIGASERVFALLDRQPEVAGGTRRLEAVRGEVTLDAVSFHYPARPDAVVLEQVQLALNPGEVVALVGPSGGGKSTIAALVSRFYDPQGGRLLLDGVPYVELEPTWLREQVGVVSQEPVLFATTIADNIRYGRPTASLVEVEAAARAANAHDFITAFPDGYLTLVGERGVRLSGGQKQRVAIARALLKDPRVLVLDEATSALDAESEHLVQEALDRLMQGRTTLVIAHRLSTVKEADRVIVLDGGRVAEQGTHEELLAMDGIYKKLVERQFSR